MEVEVNFGNDVKALFPQMSISCTCKMGKGHSVSCSMMQLQQGKWEVTFQTTDPGTYTVTATLKIGGEDFGPVKAKTIQLDELVSHLKGSPLTTWAPHGQQYSKSTILCKTSLETSPTIPSLHSWQQLGGIAAGSSRLEGFNLSANKYTRNYFS